MTTNNYPYPSKIKNAQCQAAFDKHRHDLRSSGEWDHQGELEINFEVAYNAGRESVLQEIKDKVKAASDL